jgi:hypothetical protein
MNKDVILILKDADPQTPGQTEVTVTWNNQGIEVHPAGTGTFDDPDGAPIFIERLNGVVRVVVFDDINGQDPKIVSLANARKNLYEKPDSEREKILKSLPATYTSVWDSGTEITSPCLYNTETQECFEIDGTDVDTGDANLKDEYVTLGDLQLRAEDGVTFN